MEKEYTLAEFQDLAMEAGYPNEFEYARLKEYVYNTGTKMFRKHLDVTERAIHLGVLDRLGNVDNLDIAECDVSGYAARAAIKDLCFSWRDHVSEGWPLDYLIQADGLEVSRILSRWFAKLQEELAKREEK